MVIWCGDFIWLQEILLWRGTIRLGFDLKFVTIWFGTLQNCRSLGIKHKEGLHFIYMLLIQSIKCSAGRIHSSRLSWPSRQLLSARKSIVSYRIPFRDWLLFYYGECCMNCILFTTTFSHVIFGYLKFDLKFAADLLPHLPYNTDLNYHMFTVEPPAICRTVNCIHQIGLIAICNAYAYCLPSLSCCWIPCQNGSCTLLSMSESQWTVLLSILLP